MTPAGRVKVLDLRLDPQNLIKFKHPWHHCPTRWCETVWDANRLPPGTSWHVGVDELGKTRGAQWKGGVSCCQTKLRWIKRQKCRQFQVGPIIGYEVQVPITSAVLHCTSFRRCNASGIICSQPQMKGFFKCVCVCARTQNWRALQDKTIFSLWLTKALTNTLICLFSFAPASCKLLRPGSWEEL